MDHPDRYKFGIEEPFPWIGALLAAVLVLAALTLLLVWW